jgi:two-component system response regulator HydG
MVSEGTFRNDLYFRLKVITIELPSLRDRREDIVPLMDHFRKLFLRRYDKPISYFTPGVVKRFYLYDWPGNVRQLRNFVETMVVLDTDCILGEDDLPPELHASSSGQEIEKSAKKMDANSSPAESALVGKSLDSIEKWAIGETLRLTGGNREEAAKVLGIGARTLYRRLDQYRKEDASWNDDFFNRSLDDISESRL